MVLSPRRITQPSWLMVCLVVRPAGISSDANLPVLVWIYGGGFDGGGTSDPRYNMSGIVQLSQEIGKPIVGGR